MRSFNSGLPKKVSLNRCTGSLIEQTFLKQNIELIKPHQVAPLKVSHGKGSLEKLLERLCETTGTIVDF
jgi:hypothetical protein